MTTACRHTISICWTQQSSWLILACNKPLGTNSWPSFPEFSKSLNLYVNREQGWISDSVRSLLLHSWVPWELFIKYRVKIVRVKLFNLCSTSMVETQIFHLAFPFSVPDENFPQIVNNYSPSITGEMKVQRILTKF